MASKGVNKVILVGNLGKDPEIRHMPNGGSVANLTLATSESWRDKNTGEQKEKTEWHNVSIFGKLAEIAGQYLNKGSQVYIEGALQTRKWQDQSGNDRYTTEVVVQGFNGTMQMLGGRSGGQGNYNQGNQQGGFAPQQNSAPQAAAQNQNQNQFAQPAAAPQQQAGFNQAPSQPAQGGFNQQPAQGGFNNQPQQAAPQQSAPQQAKAPDLDQGWDDDIPF